jgi:hypothetical protein
MYSSGKEDVSFLQNFPSITMSSSKIDSLNRDITKFVPTKLIMKELVMNQMQMSK